MQIELLPPELRKKEDIAMYNALGYISKHDREKALDTLSRKDIINLHAQIAKEVEIEKKQPHYWRDK